jgi:hypothetical protein
MERMVGMFRRIVRELTKDLNVQLREKEAVETFRRLLKEDITKDIRGLETLEEKVLEQLIKLMVITLLEELINTSYLPLIERRLSEIEKELSTLKRDHNDIREMQEQIGLRVISEAERTREEIFKLFLRLEKYTLN